MPSRMYLKGLSVLILAQLTSHSLSVAADTPDCVAPPKLAANFLEAQIAQSTTALRDISDVNIGAWKASSLCKIRLLTGEADIRVASDLKNFLEFVRLLSSRVKESKTRGGANLSAG